MCNSVLIRLSAAAAALALGSAAYAQQVLGSEHIDGMRPSDIRAHAITGANVVIRPGEKVENATIVIRDGVILAVGTDIPIPPGSRIWPADGKTVYPGLIDAAVLISPANDPDGAGSHWNRQITPQINMADQPAPSANLRRQLREMGFTAAAFYPDSGILRGTGTVLALADETSHVGSYRDQVDLMAGFDTGRGRGGGYPGSLMGAIALMRQTFLDAQWHAESRRVYRHHAEGNEPPIRADALEAMERAIERRQRVLFDTGNELNAMRAAKIADEFNLDIMLLGRGTEFRRLDDILALDLPMIVPVDYPSRPNVATPAEANRVSLRDLMTWEQAPTNVRRLIDGGATVALTTERLRRRTSFHGNLKRAIDHGLGEEAALAALTTTPAKLYGLDHIMGTIEPGKVANLVVVKGSLFTNRPDIYDVWVNGRRHEIKSDPMFEYAGKGELTIGDRTFDATINSARNQLRITLGEDDTLTSTRGVTQQDRLAFIVDGRLLDMDGYIQIAGAVTNDVLRGAAILPDGTRLSMAFHMTEEVEDEDEQHEAVVEEPKRDDQPGAADPIGEWSSLATIDGIDAEFPITITISRSVDGSLRGTSSSMAGDWPIRNVSFDSSTGRLTYTIETPEGNASIVATIEGDTLSGTMTSDMYTGTFSGRLVGGSTADAGVTVASADDSPGAAPDRAARRGPTRRGGGGDDSAKVELPPDQLPVPFGAYGLFQPPQKQNVLVRGATIWTAGPDGIIENGDLYVEDGRIAYVGPQRSWAWGSGEPLIIDAAGKHITPGLQDCHSHTGINGGVNEFASVNTAEVRISDVIDPDTVNWYRQLAGGLTLANQLHGSANPIGGQNSVVKLKWGATADEMLVDGAPLGIKFALGENVIRSTNRYPNTRMGVEAIYRDAFTAAREYEQEWQQYNNLPSDQREHTMPPRRDLELDALVAILNGEMLVHCHSYRQDEILMLIRVAEDFGFTIGTFQHVLEGFKVAEAIAAHGAGASSFSDWWGYKVEVQDAIPHNGAILHELGVLTTFNSDSSELARRMNTEASKAVRYGGVDPHEALKFVSYNVAKQLGIHDRTGSLETGKDADFVIWSADPLSTYAIAEQTWIEGVRYFDIETDRELRKRAAAEHRRLVQKVLADQHGSAAGSASEEEDVDEADDVPAAKVAAAMVAVPTDTPERMLLARYIFQQQQQYFEQMLREGRDPEQMRPGDCGCGVLDWWSMLR